MESKQIKLALQKGGKPGDIPKFEPSYLTHPAHGGKVTCHKCEGFIKIGEEMGYLDHQHREDFPSVHFHKLCFNSYEHYYGLDKPID